MKPDEVVALLAEAMPGLLPVALGTEKPVWKLAAVDGRRTSAAVRVAARWISIEATLPRDRDMNALRTLHMQSALPGSLKVVRQHRGFGLRAEIPLLVEIAPARDWLRRHAAIVYAALRAALGHTNATPEFPEGDGIEFDPVVIAERCTAGGWLASVRADAEVRVEFDSRSAHRIVTLSRHGNAIRAAVTLETGALAEQGPDMHLALAVLLLRATDSLRWVRAFATSSGDTLEAAGFECMLALPGADQPLIMALDALATACELYGCEAEALAASAVLAQHYLALEKDVPGRPLIPADRVPADSAPAAGAITEVALA